MSLEQTQQTINRYFQVMSDGDDLAECSTADITWTTTDTGEELRGASSVRDYVVALHNNMFAAQTRRLVVADGHAYLEGDWVEAPTGTGRRIYQCEGRGRAGGSRPADTTFLPFCCCHPNLAPASQVALTLRAVGGLTTREIADAFQVPAATMAQRISRAKRALQGARARGRGRPGPRRRRRAARDPTGCARCSASGTGGTPSAATCTNSARPPCCCHGIRGCRPSGHGIRVG